MSGEYVRKPWQMGEHWQRCECFERRCPHRAVGEGGKLEYRCTAVVDTTALRRTLAKVPRGLTLAWVVLCHECSEHYLVAQKKK